MPIIPTKVKSKKLVEKRREQIVLAAIKLFSQKGFHKTTLRELAEETGISHANIYDYVANKEDIFFLIHEFVNRIIQNALEKTTEGIMDPVEKLRRMVRSEFNFMHKWSDAIMIIYRETQVLNKPLLYKLLEKEREHVSKFEIVLEECIKKGRIRDIDVRVASNLIKTMAETWVVKRWDLRGHVNRLDMEKSILDLVFKGLGKKNSTALTYPEPMNTLQGKTALIVNGGTMLGSAITVSLISKGVKLAVYVKDRIGVNDFPVSKLKGQDNLNVYSLKEYGQMNIDLFKKILDCTGSVDLIIHDLGTHYTEPENTKKRLQAARNLELNLRCAEDLATAIQAGIPKMNLESIIYVAPWAWDSYADHFRYSTVKEGTMSLTKVMARLLAPTRTRVNCIVPGFISGIKPSKIEKEKASDVIDRIPIGQLGEMADVLDALYFLVSDGSKYITGQVLDVSGGIDYH